MADPTTILAILQFVCTAATAVIDKLNKALEVNLKHEAQRALKELRKGPSLTHGPLGAITDKRPCGDFHPVW